MNRCIVINLISNLKPDTTRVLNRKPVQHLQYTKALTTDTVSFTGLNKTLSKRLFETHAELKEFIDKHYPNSTGVVGNLPTDWVMSFPKEERGNKTRQIIKSFGDAAEKIKTFGQIYAPCQNTVDEASDIITNTLLEQGLIKQVTTEPKQEKSLLKSIFKFLKKPPTLDEQIQKLPAGQLIEIGCGSLGRAFAFKDDSNTYVLKAFHYLDHKTIKEELTESAHYELMEPNRASFIKRNADEHEFPEFYFADLNRGFMVTKYIDDDYKVNEKLDNKAFGLIYHDDRDDNFKNEATVDYGDLRTVSPFLNKNKTARWVYLTLANKTSAKDRVDKWNELFNEANANTIPNTSDILVGLYDFVRFLPHKKKSDCYEKFNHLNNFKGDFKTYLASFSIKPLPDETPKTLRQKALEAANMVRK